MIFNLMRLFILITKSAKSTVRGPSSKLSKSKPFICSFDSGLIKSLKHNAYFEIFNDIRVVCGFRAEIFYCAELDLSYDIPANL